MRFKLIGKSDKGVVLSWGSFYGYRKMRINRITRGHITILILEEQFFLKKENSRLNLIYIVKLISWVKEIGKIILIDVQAYFNLTFTHIVKDDFLYPHLAIMNDNRGGETKFIKIFL